MGNVISITRNVYTAVYNEVADQWLFARRSSKSDEPFTWGLFGGNADTSDHLEIAALRELYNQTGIKLDCLTFQFLQPPFTYFYTCSFRYAKIPVLNETHDSWGWFNIAALKNMPTHNSTKMFLDHITKKKAAS